jgi:superfamily II DNA or RNA helicase
VTTPLPWTDTIEERALELVECKAEGVAHQEQRQALMELLHVVLVEHGAPTRSREIIGHVNRHLEEPIHVPTQHLNEAVKFLCIQGRAKIRDKRLCAVTSKAHREASHSGVALGRAWAKTSPVQQARSASATQATLAFDDEAPASLQSQPTLPVPPTSATRATAVLETGITGVVGPGTHPVDQIPAGKGSIRLRPGSPLAGRRRYRLETLAGRGGMGEVWKGMPEDELGPQSPVAIKTVKASRGVFWRALQQELDLLRTLSRADFFPFIHEDFTLEGQLFLVMDWVEGLNLAQFVKVKGVERVDRVLFRRIMEQVADRLSYLHAWQPRLIIFRDLKPSNIMLDQDTAHLRLVDFGISHLAADEKALRAGTKGYLAPEASGGDATVATDIFAMGRVALFLLFGHERFQEIRRGMKPPSHIQRELPAALVDAALRLAHKDPHRRPASALQALDCLAAALRSSNGEAKSTNGASCPRCSYPVALQGRSCCWCGAWLGGEVAHVPGGPPLEVGIQGLHTLSAEQPVRTPHRLQEHLEALARVRASADLGTLRCLPTIHVRPYPYQQDAAVQVLSVMQGRAMIADDVGLGKTIEAGLVIKEYLLRGMIRTCLIVSPPGLLLQQIKEEMANKFGLDFLEYRSNGDWDDNGRVGPRGLASADLVIVSYNTLARDNNLRAFRAHAWDLLLADECHKVKNRKTKRYKAIRALAARRTLFLSATPFSGKREELWNVYSAIRPGFLGVTKHDFERMFRWDGEPSAELRERLRSMTIRRRRQEVLVRFPGRQAVRVSVAGDPRFSRIYKEVSLATQPQGTFAHLTALQQVVTSYERMVHSAAFQYLSPSLQQELRGLSDADHPKIRALLDRVVSRLPSNEKVVVFTRFRESQAAVRRLLGTKVRRGEAALGLLGYTGQRRADVLHQFRDDPGARFLVCGEGAGEGLNLQFSSIMINVDLPWNPMRLEQRIGRIQRLGQPRNKVTVVNLSIERTVEDRVLEVLTEKLRMFELVVGQTEQILGQLFKSEDSKKNDFERWFAEVLLADGGVDERRLRQKMRELDQAERRARLDQEQGGAAFDRVFGRSGKFESQDDHAPQEPAIDLSFLGDDDV